MSRHPSPYIPAEIKVGPYDFEVILDDSLEDLGQFRPDLGTFVIQPDQAAASLRDSVLHECLHGVWFAASGNLLLNIDKNHEERVIRLLSPWILGLLRDNPELLTFLLAGESS